MGLGSAKFNEILKSNKTPITSVRPTILIKNSFKYPICVRDLF